MTKKTEGHKRYNIGPKLRPNNKVLFQQASTAGGFLVFGAVCVATTLRWFSEAQAADAQPGRPSQEKAEPDPIRGLEVAQKLCTNCHVVSNYEKRSSVDSVPTFREIANLPNQTGQRIRRVILQPSHSMPAVTLTRTEIDDIIAYLDEIRDKGSGAPLVPNKAKDLDKKLQEPS